MKAICSKINLKEAVGLCEKITGKNLSLPVLSNILISGEGRRLKLTSTNLEIGLGVEIPAKIEEKGMITVPAGVVNSFLSSLSTDENITLESQHNSLLILTSNTSTLIKGQPCDDFPVLPTAKEGNIFEIPVSEFISGLKSVSYAASFLNIKPEISSVYAVSDKAIPLTFVATDSFRLAEKKTNLFFPGFKSILIPMKSVSEILRIFDGREGMLKLTLDKNQMFISLDGIDFISRLTEGVFPDYQQIIPTKFVTDAVLDKNSFSAALKTASIFSGKLNEINIGVDPESESMTISTSSSESGEHTGKIKANTTGKKLKMSFNHRYIFDCLQYIPSKEIILRFSGEEKPLIISGVDDNSFRYLVMPMNTL